MRVAVSIAYEVVCFCLMGILLQVKKMESYSKIIFGPILSLLALEVCMHQKKER